MDVKRGNGRGRAWRRNAAKRDRGYVSVEDRLLRSARAGVRLHNRTDRRQTVMARTRAAQASEGELRDVAGQAETLEAAEMRRSGGYTAESYALLVDSSGVKHGAGHARVQARQWSEHDRWDDDRLGRSSFQHNDEDCCAGCAREVAESRQDRAWAMGGA